MAAAGLTILAQCSHIWHLEGQRPVTGLTHNLPKFKIDVVSLSGSLASTQLPSNLALGNYLTRHEIIALHLAKSLGGAEFYPACSQLTVGASGTGVPDPLGGHLPGACSDNDPGIFDSQVFDACAPYIHLPRSSCRCICERWHFHSWKRNHNRIFKGNGNPDRWCHWDIDDV
ncbi:glycoside hydrolase family 61 protein [Laccaria bicolor S238N-H82]|uniref:lytic cellulose monooxygenase (C4-dehydrogenating) n=1 Tax=Laccaria bicolor (strain S238N-H82 / ATCC MYA-4686) TaxID=486041 RepID=B0DVP6_LACBS|nr:glycoside hydrolase family 61 protein [Laccaria bicolor S238N-H82]EDR01287.1 glycoside hydrolase family 61 protein [Laccaria bicolor S238N-H82]|eukprot:XP_001887994.1 glycoside hydrolase family 61 protein [Laccaria bicolor S238N-H82]